MDDEVGLTAYRLDFGSELPLMTAPPGRVWMDASTDRYANRCLPMLIANQSGWLILNSFRVAMTWNGGPGRDDIVIEYADGDEPLYPARSHFAGGIVTWNLPYLFQTPPGYSLHVRGPANCPKDGVYALEGLVETDWGKSTFTMNWRLTRPGLTVVFEVDEPICQVLPVQREAIEHVVPVLRHIADEPAIQAETERWTQDRNRFLEQLDIKGSEAQQQGWQKDYFQGRHILGGEREPTHRTRLRVRDFTVREPDDVG